MKSNPPTAQRRSPRRHQGQATGVPKIQTSTQKRSVGPTEQAGSRKRKMIIDDDDDSDNESAGKQPKQAIPSKKKTASHPMPKIRRSSRYKSSPFWFHNTHSCICWINLAISFCVFYLRKLSDIDPTGKSADPAASSEAANGDLERRAPDWWLVGDWWS